jgi:hypothetical protein
VAHHRCDAGRLDEPYGCGPTAGGSFRTLSNRGSWGMKRSIAALAVLIGFAA